MRFRLQIRRLQAQLGESAVWQRILVVCLVTSALPLIPGMPPFVRILAAWLLVCLMPGLLIWDAVFRTHNANLLEALPLCFALSLAGLIPVTVLGFLLRLSPPQLVLVFYLTLAALALANYAVNWRRSPPTLMLFPPDTPKIFTAMLLAVLGIAVMLIRIGPYWGADTWYHLTMSRAVADGSALDLGQVSRGFGGSYAYPLWSIAVALIARVASADIFEVWYYMPAILTLLAVMAAYNLAYTLFQSRPIASAAGLVFLAWAYYGSSPMSFYMLSMLSVPDVLSLLILFPLFLSSTLSWALEHTWHLRSPLLLVCLGAPLAAIHNSQYFYALALLSGFSVMYAIIWRRDWDAVAKLALLVTLSALVFVGGFEFAKWLTNSGTTSDPLAIIEARNLAERVDIDPLRYAYPLAPLLSWMLPAALALFLAGREQTQRTRATFILAALLIGPAVYFDTPLLGLALKTIPKLNRFAIQVHDLTIPLIGGWSAVTLFTLLDAGLTRLGEWYRRGSPWHYGGLVAASGLLGLAVVWLAPPQNKWFGGGATLTLTLTAVCLALAFLAALLSSRLYPYWTSFRSKFASSFWGRGVALICAVTWLVLNVILPGSTLLAADLAQGGSWAAEATVPVSYSQVPDWWDDGLTGFLRERVPGGSRILAECWPTWYLGALTPHDFQYDQALLTILDPRTDLPSFMQVLGTRNIDYILLTKGTAVNGRCPIDDERVMIDDFAYLEPVLERYPAVFEKVYASSSNVVWHIVRPHTDPSVASTYWKSYELYANTGDQANALTALQLWTLFNPDPAARCEALRLSTKYVDLKQPAAGKNALHTDDIAALQSGARVVDSVGFSTRLAYSPWTAVNSNRFDGFAATYTGTGGRLECPAWATIDLGQPRAIKAVGIEWTTDDPARAWQLDYREGDHWQRLADSSTGDGQSRFNYDLPQTVSASQVRLTLTAATGPGLVGLWRLSLYEHPGFTPPGTDVALLSAGTTVEDSSPVLDLGTYRIENAIDGDELDGNAAVAGGPDQSYPHWFTLNFNQERSVYALEIQWYDKSYGQDWLVSYFDRGGWHPLKEEHGWQPPADYLYRYVLPQPIQASKIRLDVNWASGGRMVVRRFSAYGK
jgi:hypothetical protein